MHRLMTALGLPQRRFASIHVVGTNGKSSTVRFCAAILERHGLRTGSYTSPHLRSFRERIEVGEEPVVRGRLRRRGRRARPHAAELVNRTARARRPGHPVRGAHRGRLPRAGPARGGGGGDRGRAGRALRRHQRDPVARCRCSPASGLEHTRWLGPTLARHRRGEARRGARPRRRWWCGELEPEARGGGRAGGRRAPRARWCRRRRPAAAAAARRRAASSARNFALAARRGRGVPRPRARPGRGAPRRGRDARARAALEVGGRAPAHGLRRRPQPGRGARRWPSRSPRCSATAGRAWR